MDNIMYLHITYYFKYTLESYYMSMSNTCRVISIEEINYFVILALKIKFSSHFSIKKQRR